MSINELATEPWLLLVPAVIIICIVILRYSRVRLPESWRADRRGGERRRGEQRTGNDRRSEVRQRHDQTHNTERRREERRKQERRNGAAWQDEYKTVKNRLEEKQHDHRNVEP